MADKRYPLPKYNDKAMVRKPGDEMDGYTGIVTGVHNNKITVKFDPDYPGRPLSYDPEDLDY